MVTTLRVPRGPGTALAKGAPHSGQNLASPATPWPHAGQGATASECKGE